jgi:hypothetical protein
MFPPIGGATQQLDQAPPSPQSMGAGPTGSPTPFSMQALAPPTTPADQMPPEILTAILQSAQKIGSMLDSYAQVAPDLAAQFAMIKDQLATVLAQLTTKGAGAMSPTASGQQAPMGGMDRGIAGAGMV